MKKVLLTMTLVAVFGFANAQTEEGGWYVGASSNLSFTSTSFDGQEDNDTNFNLEGKAGYFVMDNLNVGLLLGISSSKDGLSEIKRSATVFGPYARYYVDGQFFVGAGYGISNAKIEDGNGTTLGDASGGNILFEAGYPIWLVDKIAIEPVLNYTVGTGDFDTSSAFGIAVGFGLYF